MFEIYQSEKNKKFHFRLKAKNGQIVLSSQGYKDRAGCKNGIKSVAKNAAIESRFELSTSSNGKHYFNLKASNGEIIGTSQMYAAKDGAKKGIASVCANAASSITDLTA